MASTQKPIRAALYARVSTVNHGQDVNLQVEELRAVAAQRGWTVVGVYKDEGISGTKDSRPELDRMMSDARAGKFDVLLVWKLDRLGRGGVAQLLGILDSLAQWGVDFSSVRDPGMNTTTSTGRLLMQLLAVFAAYEREVIQERVIAGVRRAQAAGKHCGRPVVELDLRPAVALIEQGRGLKDVSKILGVSRSTLRRRLHEAGAWPRSASPDGQSS